MSWAQSGQGVGLRVFVLRSFVMHLNAWHLEGDEGSTGKLGMWSTERAVLVSAFPSFLLGSSHSIISGSFT